MKDPDPVSCHDAQNARYTLNYEEPLTLVHYARAVGQNESLYSTTVDD